MTKEEIRKTAAKIAALGMQIRQHKPLVHCITNPIAIHDSANIILAAGGRPVMAEHPEEVEEIVKTAQALVLNLGNITDVRMRSMKKAFQEALETADSHCVRSCGNPVQQSAVSVRRRTAGDRVSDCLKRKYFREMRKLAGLSTEGTGVDAGENDRFSEKNEDQLLAAFCRLSENCQSVLLVTGQEDLIIAGSHCYCLKNGDAMLGTITGTGCMLGALCGAYLAGQPCHAEESVLAAAAVMGIAGESGSREQQT